jgi:exopolyphosphatase/guanosine-5'-triphosphate,3'-diphosphate pyrophosphatase
VTLARTPVVAASVDVGSNSVHLLAAVVAGHRLVPLVDESELLGLGATVDAEGRLGTARRTELVSVLARYVETARQLGCASVALVGTEPLRVASDADRVVEDVRLDDSLAQAIKLAGPERVRADFERLKQ